MDKRNFAMLEVIQTGINECYVAITEGANIPDEAVEITKETFETKKAEMGVTNYPGFQSPTLEDRLTAVEDALLAIL